MKLPPEVQNATIPLLATRNSVSLTSGNNETCFSMLHTFYIRAVHLELSLDSCRLQDLTKERNTAAQGLVMQRFSS